MRERKTLTWYSLQPAEVWEVGREVPEVGQMAFDARQFSHQKIDNGDLRSIAANSP